VQAGHFLGGDREPEATALWRGEAHVAALRQLLVRFLGRERADSVFAADTRRRGHALAATASADPALLRLVEWSLARGIGTASARIMVGSITRGEALRPGDLLEILDEASQMIDYSRRLEQKSRDLEYARDQLRIANNRLQQLDTMKDEFVATVSHELRTPLTSIRAFSEILLDTPDLQADETRRFLQIISREAERLTRLVNDVLDLSRIEAGRMEWHVQPCDLADVIAEAVAATLILISERGVRLETDIAVRQAVVEADRDRLLQVVVNLVSNAAKFAPEQDGRVLVRLIHENANLLVRVEDNGPGVPEDERSRVFERFTQAGKGLTSKPKGSGLGLTISRQIIEHFGGRIWLEPSALGGNATCFSLPLMAADQAAA
jgi:signal transduction histidine kinase